MANAPAGQDNIPPEEEFAYFYGKIRDAALEKVVGLRIAREDARLNGIPGAKDEIPRYPGGARDSRWGNFYEDLVNAANTSIDRKREDELLPRVNDFTNFFASLFQAIGTISALGAGFIFTVLFTDIEPSLKNAKDTRSDARYIRNCLMVAWLLFVLSTLLASIAVALMSLSQFRIAKGWKRKVEEWSFSLGSIFLGILVLTLAPLGAFVAVSLALRKYNNAIGIVAIASIASIGVSMIVIWLRATRLISPDD